MGLPGTIGSLALPDSSLNRIVDKYRRLRPTRLRLNNSLVARLPKDVLTEGARRLGILRDGAFVFGSEDESTVLMDYCIYDVFRNGRNAVEQYLLDCPPAAGSDEEVCLRAMQGATYGLAVVLQVQSGTGCLIENLYTNKQHLLVDLGFSRSATPGLLLGTRLLDFGEYVASGGAAIPLGVLTAEQLAEWRERLSAGAESNEDPAPLIREALRRGAASRIQYAGVESAEAPYRAEAAAIPQDPRARKRAMAKYLSAKAAPNERCRCGSGKMYKNCCMNR
jgi:hypothetical protein